MKIKNVKRNMFKRLLFKYLKGVNKYIYVFILNIATNASGV